MIKGIVWLIALVVWLVTWFVYRDSVDLPTENTHVAWRYGKKCYDIGQEPNTIKHHMYFESLEDCESFISSK